jgi:hypothetical protein
VVGEGKRLRGRELLPAKSIICGRARCAVMARRRAGLDSRWSRSPASVLATWSWFCVNTTNDHGGTSSAGVPRALPCQA